MATSKLSVCASLYDRFQTHYACDTMPLHIVNLMTFRASLPLRLENPTAQCHWPRAHLYRESVPHARTRSFRFVTNRVRAARRRCRRFPSRLGMVKRVKVSPTRTRTHTIHINHHSLSRRRAHTHNLNCSVYVEEINGEFTLTQGALNSTP